MRRFLLILLLSVWIAPVNAAPQMVSFNTSSGKYHDVGCQWAKRCTRSCVKVDKSEAIKRGGVPCKVCGG